MNKIRTALWPPEPGRTRGVVHQPDRISAGLDDVLAGLREIARGLHPAILAESGLSPALKALARRCAGPARLDIEVDRRLPEPVETAACYTVSRR
jgi:signal transduction histidine kinase